MDHPNISLVFLFVVSQPSTIQMKMTHFDNYTYRYFNSGIFCSVQSISFSLFFFKDFVLFIFRQRGKEGEKHQCVVTSHAPPTGDLACNPGMCPDWVSNQWPFCSQAGAQSTEPYHPGLFNLFLRALHLIEDDWVLWEYKLILTVYDSRVT